MVNEATPWTGYIDDVRVKQPDVSGPDPKELTQEETEEAEPEKEPLNYELLLLKAEDEIRSLQKELEEVKAENQAMTWKVASLANEASYQSAKSKGYRDGVADVIKAFASRLQDD